VQARSSLPLSKLVRPISQEAPPGLFCS
jgi:hypothetical protein